MHERQGLRPAGDFALLSPFLPQDSSRQFDAFKQLLRVAGRRPGAGPIRLLDLGCGAGGSYFRLLRAGMSVEWHGLDIEDSPEAAAAAPGARPAGLQLYDGLHIPFEDGAFEIVYSRQSFEHVLYPRELIREVGRVLKARGVFVGSCSALEPFHSRSLCNFTPYGFATLLREAGLREIALRPGVDGLSLICRRLLGFVGTGLGSWIFAGESPLNLLLELATRIMGFDTRRRAAAKLLFCGHFVFTAAKPPLSQ